MDTELNLIGNIVYTKYVISRILYVYCTDEAFRKSVDEAIASPMTATVNGENIIDPVWNLELRCDNIAKQFVDAYTELISEGEQ